MGYPCDLKESPISQALSVEASLQVAEFRGMFDASVRTSFGASHFVKLIPPVVSSCLWNIPTYGIHGEKLWVNYIWIKKNRSDPKSDIMWTIHPSGYLRNGMVEMTGMTGKWGPLTMI